jgi:arginase
LAVKIVRQPMKIALLGAPSSAAALSAGHERAPAALREAGLIPALVAAGFEVTDLGDATPQLFQPDDEHPRARNLPRVLAGLRELRPRVEIAVKSGALPLVIGGDCMIVLGTIAGTRRYYRNVGLVYMDSDADLNEPATSPSGCVDGMVISHVIGKGAAEMIRFWNQPPLVREPEIALFGVSRTDPAEDQFLTRTPMRAYRASDISKRGAAVAAQQALDRMHGAGHEFVLHFDVDVISSDEFRATNYPSVGALRLAEAREALAVFARQPHLAAMTVCAYNPALDPDGSAAKLLIELIVEALAPRLAVPSEAPAVTSESAAVGEAEAAPAAEAAPVAVSAPSEETAQAAGNSAAVTEEAIPEPPTAAEVEAAPAAEAAPVAVPAPSEETAQAATDSAAVTEEAIPEPPAAGEAEAAPAAEAAPVAESGPSDETAQATSDSAAAAEEKTPEPPESEPENP